jgi:Xaa-Pro dipeptidase
MNSSHRMAELRRYMDERDLALCIVLNPDNQQYLSGFRAVIYSRPIVLVVAPRQLTLIAPGLEEVHARAEAQVDELFIYYEHPEMAAHGKTHLHHLDGIVERLPRGARVGVEAETMSLALASHLTTKGVEPVDVGPKVAHMRFIKDEQEIEVMVEAGRLAALGVGASLEALAPGITELELDGAGNAAILAEVAARHPGATVDLMAMSPAGAVRTVMPHVFSNTRPLEPGDGLIHSRQVALNGYRGESERTCFLGRPTVRQEHAFQVMLEAQRAGLAALRAGIPMRAVDEASRSVIQKAGMGEYFIHRTGHGLGLAAHEPPFLRFDEEMLLEEGMVLTVEPALMIPGLGGFRHSDTAIVTATGCTVTTEFPYELEDLIWEIGG